MMFVRIVRDDNSIISLVPMVRISRIDIHAQFKGRGRVISLDEEVMGWVEKEDMQGIIALSRPEKAPARADKRALSGLKV